MVSIGHRTGLFDAMAELPPSKIDAIADQAGLIPRHVKEWLGTMAARRIVRYMPETQLYDLPSEHTSLLTLSATRDNIAAFTQYTGMLGEAEDSVVDCFREGGGVGYEHYPRFRGIAVGGCRYADGRKWSRLP